MDVISLWKIVLWPSDAGNVTTELASMACLWFLCGFRLPLNTVLTALQADWEIIIWLEKKCVPSTWWGGGCFQVKSFGSFIKCSELLGEWVCRWLWVFIHSPNPEGSGPGFTWSEGGLSVICLRVLSIWRGAHSGFLFCGKWANIMQ